MSHTDKTEYGYSANRMQSKRRQARKVRRTARNLLRTEQNTDTLDTNPQYAMSTYNTEWQLRWQW